jgi:hypothetical protein
LTGHDSERSLISEQQRIRGRKLRKFGNRNSDEVVVPEPGMDFDSLPEAFDFFNYGVPHPYSGAR